MSTNDFIPNSDAEFHVWQGALIAIVQPSVTTWGILPADMTALTGFQATWIAAYNKASNKQNRTAADVQIKDDARKAYEKAIRTFVAQWLSSNTKVSNGERERMGLTVKTGTRTAATVPSTSPVGTIDFSVHGQHSISFVDQLTPTSKAKPDGVMAAEVWAKVGDATDYTYIGLSTRTPYVAKYTDTDAGKTATYRLRWVNTHGEQGPWSSPVSSIIVG